MSVFRLLFLCVFCFAFLPTQVYAAKDTPGRVVKNKLYRTYNKMAEEQKFPIVMRNIMERLNAPYSSRNDLNVVMFWLRDQYLYDNGDPKYGLGYVQFLESLTRNMKDSNPEQAETLKQNSVIHYFVSEHFIISDIARCADPTAGQNTRNELEQMRQNHLRRFAAMKYEDKETVFKTIFELIQERKNRTPYTEICKSGEIHMKKALESGKFTQDLQTKDGSQAFIDDNLPPDLINEQEWAQRYNSVFNALKNDLLALQ
ncbi:MAG: hypothetical protein ACTHPO_10950 [Alphaproteobacteria bacterium]|jgi:hypothetical protein|nr:hypothetical protein [Pseudomonadota bacterium]